DAGPIHGLEIGLEHLGAVAPAVLAFVPLDRHAIERGLRPPPAVGDDRHGRIAIFLTARPEIGVPPWTFALDLDHGVNAGAILDDTEVVALQSAAEDRTRLDRGVEHPRQIDVDAVDRLAGHLERNVAIFLLRPDQCELIRSFDLDVFRIW